MAKHRYINSGVLFDDDDTEPEHDRNGFRSRIPLPIPKETSNRNMDDDKQQTVQKIQDIEKRTLDSVKNSLNLLQETKCIGIHAARDLAGQGDQLRNTNIKLDEINANLKQSQKDINGIKSMFHGFKEIITRKSRSPSPCNRRIKAPKSPKIERSKFYDSTDSLQGKITMENFKTPPIFLEQQSLTGPQSSQQVDVLLEASLVGMMNQLDDLKLLGVELGKEIDSQNVLIDIIEDKVERADIKIVKQNKDMNKLL